MPVEEPDRLLGRWVHSREEDEGGRVVYRRSGFPFPPARGRTSITLSEGGELELREPGPDDRTRTIAGMWDLRDDTLTLAPAGRAARYTVESVDDELLVLLRTD
jgi:hypothetical protein